MTNSFQAGVDAAIAVIKRRYMGDNNREDMEVKRCLEDLAKLKLEWRDIGGGYSELVNNLPDQTPKDK